MATLLTKRAEWISNTVQDCLGCKEAHWEECIQVQQNAERIDEFLLGQGPNKIFFYFQVQEQQQQDDIKEAGQLDPQLFVTYGDTEGIKERAVWFLRNVAPDFKGPMKIQLDTPCDNDIFWGEITPNPIPQLCRSMEYFYHLAINKLADPIDAQQWQKCNEESVNEFLGITNKFNQEVKGAIDLMTPGQEFFKLDAEELKKFENDSSKIDYYNKKFVQWIDKIKKKLNDDSESRKDSSDAGPRSELEYWRTRMQDITNWNEQLKSHDFQFVKRTLMVQSKHDQQGKKDDQINQAINEYNRLDLLLTDKLNEAKDNVKYLATLEKFIEPLYVGTPQQIIDSLPALMNAIKMVHTIARFYNTSDKMTGLFMKITNQMIINCKSRIMNGAKKTEELWKREPSQLIDTLHQCIKLYREYKSCYNETKKKVAEMPKGKQFDFSETQIFQKFEHFVRRLNKLIDIFLNIQQFNALAKHNLEDMDQLTHKFNDIIDQFKKTNKTNLLDTNNITFDRDWVEFNVQISKLDQELQAFIDSNFARFSDIEYSLKLLKKFESTIRRDPLKHNLKQKYNSILHNYALELDTINTVFKDSRDNPQNLQYNIVRNMPSEAGKIVWAKHLFQKITAPIQMFPEDVIQSGEIKKYYAVYNALGKSLTIYELWYKQNWVNEIERSKAALQATLIVRHEKYAKLWVNFDYEILQLIREAKCLDRQGVDIPESARIILLQEEKFKMYKNELEYALKEYERINSKIKPICKELLQSHLDDLELKLRPGMVTLTWTSMNIDQYLQHIHEGLKKLEQLIINVNDIIENRIENNLKQVSKFILVNLPNDSKPMTLEEFVTEQENFIQKETNKLISKNLEVEKAVDDLITTICQYPLDPHIDDVSEEQTKKIKRYYFWYFYQALLNSTQNSLNAMKYRVCGKKNSNNSLSNLKPFFEVQVQLQGKEVSLSPSLDQIQKSINRAATALLRCSKKLYNWNQSQKDNDKKDTFYDMIAQDKEIVKVILLLTGSIQGTRNKVNEFLKDFESYSWMFQDNIQEKIKAFSKSQPTLQDYEDQLKKFTNIEEEIDRFPESHKIGAMELKTKDICDSLKRCAKEWKKFYSEDLHTNARSKLDILTEQTKTLQISLSKDVKDINSLGHMMATLEEIRKKQAEIDMQFNPVLEMYQLLDTHLPGGITDKDEQDNRSLLRKNWDSLIIQSENKRKQMQEQQSIHLKTLKRQIKEFVKDVEDFRRNYEENGPMVPKINPQEAMERLRAFENEFLVKKEFYNINRRGEELFGLQKQAYPSLEKTESEIKNLKKLYDLYDVVIKSINAFKEKSWYDTSRDDLLRIEEDAQKYGENCVRLPADLKSWDAYKELKQKVEDLKQVLPMIIELKKDSIQERHWMQICDITGKQLNFQNPDLMLMEDIMNCGLLEHQEDIIDITESAEKQKKIRNNLDEIDADWAILEFEFGHWGKREPPLLLAGVKVSEILEKLDEDQMTLAATNAARHVAPFKQEVEGKIRIFSDVNSTLDLWFKVQKLWQSLEPVFTGGDIARQMPREAKTFAGIDKNWGKIMEKAVETKKVIPCCQNDMLKDFLPELNTKLEECQKSLNDYLEGKRKSFPRFYFVSDSTQLKILSSGSEPTSVQEDFEKLFDAISKVNFEKDTEKKGSNLKVITAIYNVIGQAEEMIPLDQNVKCEGNIEWWLLDLEKSMQETLLDICRKAVQTILQQKNQGLEKFAMDQPAQVSLMGIQVLWTQFMTEGLEGQPKRAMEEKKQKISQMMDILSNMCLQDLPSKIHRIKIETLVTIQVHQYDISQEIKCKDVNDFEWQKQTRMYWKNEEDNCFISITDWDAPYCYEYLGAKERLCVTPLTDRCYITLAQAMSMYYGGAPAGPAGTGKTETVKDLGRTLGLFVVVTNCSDQHRYRDMAKIFKGLCQSGLWGCFDEFNRIDLEVLSVVAMQVESITSAKKQHLEKFMFPEEPNPIPLNLSVSYFITMNPGYAGRQELPENLKVLFRGVTMMVPDREIIMKVKLASVGYSERGPLSKKFNVLYKLCEEQLSKQRHYDFGLRNILSVLRTAGNTKRQEVSSAEEMLLMRSLRDMNLSKLVADDIPLFNGLLADIFPKQTNPPKKTYPDIEKAIPQVVEQFQTIVNTDTFNLKIIQLYETYLVRHGYMLVGPTGSGKTTIAKILTEAIGICQGVPTRMVRLNPKAITSQQMYGVDIAGDWVPGVFSTIWEKSNNRALKHNTWIVCDGPVDAIWIENLNTVLDDNKILTLANGERILMTENCKLTFEVQDLNNASPATVSRCGQVYVSPTDLGFQSILDGWLLTRKNKFNRNDEAEKLSKIFQKYFVDLQFITACQKAVSKDPMMYISDLLQITQFLNLLNGVLVQFTQQQKQLESSQLEKIVIYAFTWAFGGLYESDERAQFHEFLRDKGCPLPQKKESQTIFDFYIDGNSVDWRLCIPDEWVPPSGKGGLNFSALLIPTLDSTRCEQIFNYIFGQEKIPRSDKTATLTQSVCLTIGGAGTAKTSSVIMYSQKFDKDKMLFKRINFSSATTPKLFQQTIEAECDFKVGKDFAPPQNKNMTIFIDDMSMPEVNKWGDQITLEIVRQLVEQGGFYILDKALIGQFKNIKNLQYIGAMNHPGGGRNDIPNRMKRHCFIFNMILPLDIAPIYQPIIQHTFAPKYFSEEVNKVINGLTKATIELWNKVKSTMLPTPTKFHYLFNMRELARIFKGILGTNKKIIQQASQTKGMKPETFLVGLWRHECERVFVDKMTNYKDKDTVTGYINEISLDNFSFLDSQIQENFGPDKQFHMCYFLREDIRQEDGTIEVPAEKIYEGVTSLSIIKKRGEFILDDFNQLNPSKKMNLVLFDDALRHLLRISRIIMQPRSSALLVGVGGSGKQSLTKLAAFIQPGNFLQQIVISKSYGEKELKEDIKIGFEKAGKDNKPVVFLMTDAEVKNEEFLEYINMILSTGEIPGLFQKDEKEIAIGAVRNDYVKSKNLGSNVEPTPSDLWEFFIERIRDNYHLVLAFSPVGQKFRDRSRKFPALFNECTIDWFLPWPEEALVSVAETFITNFNQLDTKPETKQELMKHMGNVHLMVNNVTDLYFQSMRRQVYVTPKSFLSFLNSYKDLYIEKYEELDKQETSYKIGLSKIDEATKAINVMEVGLKEEEAKLKAAQDQAQILLADLEVEQRKAKQKNDEVQKNTELCQEQNEIIAKEREEAQKDLEEAMPALRAAEKAVDSLKPADIVEMKTNRNPHDLIKYIMDVIVIFFQGKLGPIQIEEKYMKKKDPKPILFLKDSWEEGGKSTLGNMEFMQNLKKFPMDEINEETMELLEPYIRQRDKWFTVEAAEQVSKAASGILAWGFAIHLYHEKSKIVKPKQVFLAIQEGRLQIAQKELSHNREELAIIQKLLQGLKDNYDKQMAEKNELEAKAAKTKKKITTARQLISSLSGEKDRWGLGAREIEDKKRRLVGDVSLSCAFISYCGPFNSEFRARLATDYFENDMKKRGIPVTPKLELTKFLVDDATVGEWNIQGLPKDDLSIQNGIMVTQSTRFCLFIDPQTQGQNWVTKKYEDNIDPDYSITTQTHPKFKDRFLKHCLENGKTLIVENILNEVDTVLDPVMEKQYVRKGKNYLIDIGGTQYDYDPKFNMILTCRLSNPNFSPELSAKVTIIDFTVTQGGLEQQLLGKVISKEQKALEDSLTALLAGVNQNVKQLKSLDKDLLDRLTSSQGNLLDDAELIEVLNNTKTQAKEVDAKIKDAHQKTEEIQIKREQYRPVAIRGSALYFTMIEVSEINWMYNSSLGQFLNLFNEAIDNAPKAQLPTKRVENIIEELTFHVFKYVNRGLFEKDKTAFMLMMCFKIQTTASIISSADIGIFLKAGASLDIKNERTKPALSFINDRIWLNIIALSRHNFGPANEAIPVFKDLPDQITKNEGQWRGWFERNDPENYPIPELSEKIAQFRDIGPFLTLALIRSLREDRTRVASIQYIGNSLGNQYTSPISYPIESIWQSSTNYDPVLFLLSAGADPTTSIDDLAKKKKKFPVEKVSMGEGQEKVADKQIKKCAEEGGWIVLQNCHLGLKYMEEIEQNIINPEQPKYPLHEEFRLWITCEENPIFPLGLLQKTLKVTNEPPKGLQAGLHKTFHTVITQETIEKVEHPNWHSLIFTVCFMHSVVIERKKFGPLGWCIPYEFNYSDLEASLSFIEKYLTNQMQTPTSDGKSLLISMPVIKYMVCEVQYGGRITDDLDRELFNDYGEKYLKEGIFQPDYNFDSIPIEGGNRERFQYKIPNLGTQGELIKWQEYIATIPANDNPEVFGLHANADLTFRLKESLEMINTVTETRPKESQVGGGKTREEIVQDKARELLSKLPPDYNMVEVREAVKKLPGPKQLPDKGLTVPLNIFLFQELQRMQRVIGLVRKLFEDTIQAIDGQIIMTPEILDAINAIYDAKVPFIWLYDPSGAEISWLLSSLGSWYTSLIERNKQLNEWMRNNRPNSFWLTGFFNPQGFLTGMKQEVTRMNKKPQRGKDEGAWSLDDVVYQTAVEEATTFDGIKNQKSEGVYIHGLYLEGCKWTKQLEDADPKKMFSPLPLLYVTADNKKKGSGNERDSIIYSCPVYKYPRRNDKYLVFRVGLQCDSPQKWKLRGVALLCTTEQ